MRSYLIIGVAIVAILSGIGFALYRDGKQAAKTEQTIQRYKDNEDANNRKNAVAPADSAGTIARLRAGSF